MASQTPFTALFCSALLCVGCCCINNTLRADQRRERKRKREDEMREAITAEKEMVRETKGGDVAGRGEALGKIRRERERKEKDGETQLIRVILDVQEEERAKRERRSVGRGD